MTEQIKHSCCSKNTDQQSTVLKIIHTDPVCGMKVEETSPYFMLVDHHKYLFCSEHCKQTFENDPQKYIKEINLQKESLGYAQKQSIDANRIANVNEHTIHQASACGCHKRNEKTADPMQSHAEKPSSCCSKTEQNPVLPMFTPTSEFKAIDPVCGMAVHDPNKPNLQYQGQHFYFCNPKCLEKFKADPSKYTSKQEESGCCAISDNKKAEHVVIQPQSCCHSKQEQPSVQQSCCGTTDQHVNTQDSNTAIDPVCGMTVNTSTQLKTDFKDQMYYFCNPSCLDKFKQSPEQYLLSLSERAPVTGMDDVLFTCPMDPEIVQKGPGTCPICGMALEPMQPSLDDGPNPELVDFTHRFWTTLPLTCIVFVLAMGSHIHSFISPHIQPWIELALSLPVVLWAGRPFLERCWISYKTRNLNMWSLIGVGILAAFVYSIFATIFPALIPMQAKTGHGVAVYFEAACMIVSLSLLGQMMELKARAKTADSLRALLKLQPTKAKRVEHGEVVEVDISQIHQGDILQISSGECIPLDGVVIEGKTYIDEAMMTGEPLPVKKEINDLVIGGTVNQQGSIRVKTTAVGQNTTLAKMIQTVADAQRSKAPLQRMADVVAKYFVIIVLAISVLTFIAWMLFGHAQFDLALMCAVAVLIIACPCALGLATPMSVMATTGRAAQKGVLFKDAEAIEALSKVNTIIIDKTGTLTEGKPSLKEVKVLVPQLSLEQAQIWIASIEQNSSHPIAQTLTHMVPKDQIVNVTDFEDVSGFGVKAKIDGQYVYVGSQKLIEQLNLEIDQVLLAQLDQQRLQGNVISFLSNDDQVLAYIAVHDAIKPNAKQVVAQLIADGVDVIMATGDHEKNAKLVADELGIEKVYGNCTPQQKLDIVKKYQKLARVVAMTGDGINDAPALAQADAGIAMGNGTDIAKKTAQITLVKGDVRGVADAIHMAKKGVKNMKQNLAFSFLYNGLGVPVAAGLFYPLTGLLLTPMMAAIAMSLSSLSVVLNALRLNKS